MRAQLDTFVEKVRATEGQPVKKGQVILGIGCEGCGGAACGSEGETPEGGGRSEIGKRRWKIDEAARVAATWQKLKRDATGYRRTTMCCNG